MSQERPLSIPPGLVVRLSRAKVLPGASAQADQWMAMLSDRLDECVATLDRERMAIEIVFRLRENGEDYLFWSASTEPTAPASTRAARSTATTSSKPSAPRNRAGPKPSRSSCSCRARCGMLSWPGHCPAGKARHPV